MTATITSKGQITIPLKLRQKLHLKAGDKLEFDEQGRGLYVKKAMAPSSWEDFGKSATENPWLGMTSSQILNELRGPVELPVENGQ